MNKAFNIVGIVASVLFLIISLHYISEVNQVRIQELLESFSNSYDYGYTTYMSYGSEADDLTTEAGLISMVFFLLFVAIEILGLIKVKTATMKVLSIIGMSVTGIFLLWDFAVLSSPGAMSFDEVGVAWLLYCLIMLAFSIVGLIQSVRFEKRGVVKSSVETDVLDS